RSSRMASASGISATGMIASAPLPNAVIMVVVARRISSTTQPVRSRSRWAKAENSAGENNTSMLRIMGTIRFSFFQFCVNPRVVKEVLLRITRPGTEMCRGKLLQSRQRHGSSRKVQPAQRLHHPDIDRKCVLKPIGKKQNAIGDLAAHARQPRQRVSRFMDRQARQPVQIQFAAGNLLRRGP